MGGGNASFQFNIKETVPFTENIPGLDHTRVRIKVSVEPATIPKTDDVFIGINTGQASSRYFSTEYLLTQESIRNGQMDFSRSITLPDPSSEKNPYRIVIREVELHKSDPLRDFSGAAALVTGSQQSSDAGFAERLVFMDVFEIDD